MERPISGRRHMRAGSITVAELMRSHPTQLESGSETKPSPTGSNGDARVKRIIRGRSGHRLRPKKSEGLAKLAGLGIATVLLGGAVGAASLINEHRRAGSAEVRVRPVMEITGEQALLPDLLDGDRSAANRPATDGDPRPPRQPAANYAAPADPGAKIDVVRRFYSVVRGQPDAALGLIDTGLRVTNPARFAQAWRRVRDIHLVDARPREDGAVCAIVDMVMNNDRRLRVQQLLWFTDRTPLKIRDVEIISVQHS